MVRRLKIKDTNIKFKGKQCKYLWNIENNKKKAKILEIF